MTQQKFPALAQFCGAYFHQDWELEASDALGVIRNYLKEESRTQVQQTIQEIEQLLSLNLEPAALTNLLESELNCYYIPPAYGISHSDWLLWVQISLRQGEVVGKTPFL